MAKRIYLVRHGEPEEGYTKRFLGRLDPALSPKGREQARRIAVAAGETGVNRDYLYRCRGELRRMGVEDPYVEALFWAVTEITGEPGDPLLFGGSPA